MVRLPNLTTARLLDHAQALLLRSDPRLHAPPMRAYVADAEGWVTVIDVATPAEAGDYRVLGAILAAEMRSRNAVMAVLQFATAADKTGAETLTLVGLGAGGEEAERRIFAVERHEDGQAMVRDQHRRTYRAGAAAH